MNKLIKKDGTILCEFDANYEITISALLEQIGSNANPDDCVIIEESEVIE